MSWDICGGHLLKVDRGQKHLRSQYSLLSPKFVLDLRRISGLCICHGQNMVHEVWSSHHLHLIWLDIPTQFLLCTISHYKYDSYGYPHLRLCMMVDIPCVKLWLPWLSTYNQQWAKSQSLTLGNLLTNPSETCGNTQLHHHERLATLYPSSTPKVSLSGRQCSTVWSIGGRRAAWSFTGILLCLHVDAQHIKKKKHQGPL